MIGRRLPDAVMDEPGPGWSAWETRGPGDYMRVTWPDGDVGWYICDPIGRVGLVGMRRINLEKVEAWPGSNRGFLIPVVQDPIVEPWTVTEHDDGTITVTPSIMDPSPGGWHGYLTRGIWLDTHGAPALGDQEPS